MGNATKDRITNLVSVLEDIPNPRLKKEKEEEELFVQQLVEDYQDRIRKALQCPLSHIEGTFRPFDTDEDQQNTETINDRNASDYRYDLIPIETVSSIFSFEFNKPKQTNPLVEDEDDEDKPTKI